jgi:hypothetical protein
MKSVTLLDAQNCVRYMTEVTCKMSYLQHGYFSITHWCTDYSHDLMRNDQMDTNSKWNRIARIVTEA